MHRLGLQILLESLLSLSTEPTHSSSLSPCPPQPQPHFCASFQLSCQALLLWSFCGTQPSLIQGCFFPRHTLWPLAAPPHRRKNPGSDCLFSPLPSTPLPSSLPGQIHSHLPSPNEMTPPPGSLPAASDCSGTFFLLWLLLAHEHLCSSSSPSVSRSGVYLFPSLISLCLLQGKGHGLFLYSSLQHLA